MQIPEPPAVVDDLFFECQLAHGSPTAKIRGVGGHKQLYEAIAAAFKLDPADVLYCTVNTYKPEMDRLLSSAIPLDCLLFAHVRGQKKEVVLRKEDGHLGLTITDNHAGHVFLKRVQPDSTCGRAAPAVAVGDLVDFTLRLVSPKTSGFAAIGERSAARPQLPAASGNQTLRFLADGRSVVQGEAVDKQLLAAINAIFEEYLGVHDDELALNIWELGRECGELLEMRDRLRQSAQLARLRVPRRARLRHVGRRPRPEGRARRPPARPPLART
ncbi:PDZ domain-containing protein [Aphelenchoides fujianensis]|nr:PDZ domain-containing protein [Aphelenchoides fujianensis]